MSTTDLSQKISPAIRRAPLIDKASQLRDLSAAARDITTSAKPQILVRETATQLAQPVVLMPEAKPPVSVAAAHKQLAAERITKSIAGFYATNLRIDMKNFKRAESLLLQLKNNITDEESLTRHLSLLAKHLKQATAAKAEVTLKYNAGRISFSRALPQNAGFTQSLVFSAKDVDVYTKWDSSKQVELLRATRNAIDHSKTGLSFDVEVWKTYLAEDYKLSELAKALDIAERQRLRFKTLAAAVNKKSLTEIFNPDTISACKITSDKRVASFIDLTNARKQKLSLKVTRLVSAALLA
jgi:hypothetical protein